MYKVKMTVEYEIDYPDGFDESDVDFHLNESSWCANNALQDIKSFMDKEGRCLCNIAEFEVIE